jgi:hypothetical protein
MLEAGADGALPGGSNGLLVDEFGNGVGGGPHAEAGLIRDGTTVDEEDGGVDGESDAPPLGSSGLPAGGREAGGESAGVNAGNGLLGGVDGTVVEGAVAAVDSGNVPGTPDGVAEDVESLGPGKGIARLVCGSVGGVRYDWGPFESDECGSGNCSGILGAGPCPSMSDGIEGVVSLGSTAGAGSVP